MEGTARVSSKFERNRSTLTFSLARGPGVGAGVAAAAPGRRELAAAPPGRLQSRENFFVSEAIWTKFGRRHLGDTGLVSSKFQSNRSTLRFSLARGPGEGAGEAELTASRDALAA